MGQDLKSNEGQIHSQLTLVELLKKDPANAQAWAMLAKLVDSPERKKIYIDKALELEPDNKDLLEQARKLGIEKQPQMIAPVPVAASPAIVGNDETAIVASSSEKTAVIDRDIDKTVILEPSASSEQTAVIGLDDTVEPTIVSEPNKVADTIDQTIVSEDKSDIQQNTLVQSEDSIEETIEKETNVIAEPTIVGDVDGDLGMSQELSQADGARARVQEILSALGVQAKQTNLIEPSDDTLSGNLEDTKIGLDNPAERTVVDTIANVSDNPQDTIVQEFSELSQKDTILEANAIIDDPLATIAQDLSVNDTIVGEEEIVVDAAQQRIDQIRDSIKPMEEPAMKAQPSQQPQLEFDEPNYVSQEAAIMPSGIEELGEQTAVIDPPSRIVQGLLAFASIVAFSFFAYEFIEFLNNTTGLNWPNYR